MDIRQSHSNIRQSQTFAQARMSEFFDYFYTRKLWDFKGTENHPNLGRIDVYQIQDHAGHLIRNEKQYQIDHAIEGHHHHASHQVLPNYRQEQAEGLPKWLPFAVGIKTTQNISQHQADQLKNQIEGNIERFWNYHPEINRVFGHQQVGNDFKVFIELQGTLEQDIRQRAAEHRPYQEELLWKMLYSLVRSSHKLNTAGQSLNDIRPSRVYYNQYQLSVIPNGIAQERDLPLHHKFQSGDCVFYHNDILADLHGSANLQSSQQFRNHFANEAFQIGMTILCAGLLKTESEINVCRNKSFNQQNLDQLLNDFGTIYGNQNRLLQFTIEELFLRPTRQSPSQIWSIFDRETDHFIFLEGDLQHHLAHQYQTVQLYSARRSAFNQTTASRVATLDFKRAYPNHFHYELKKIEYDSEVQRIHTHNHHIREQLHSHADGHADVVRSSQQVRSSQVKTTTEHAKHSAHRHQPVTTTYVTSSHHHHQPLTNSQMYGSNISGSQYRVSYH